MDILADSPTHLATLLVAISTLAVSAIFVKIKLARRISPTIHYAGEESFSSRLLVPVKYGKDPINFLCQTRKKLGDVFCVDLFVTKFVFILGSEGNKDVLRAAEDHLSFWEQVRWAMGPVLERAFNYEDWQTVSPKLVRTGLLKINRDSQSASVCERITEQLFDEWAQQESVPLFQSISTLVLSCMFVLLLGEEFYKSYAAELLPHMIEFERQVQNPILRIVPKSFWKYTSAGERKPFVDACFRETARLYTGLAILRMSAKATSVHGHTIPKGTLVACSPAASQRMERSERSGIYENAGKWDPERFMKDPEAYQNWFQRAEFVQFGMGNHACPGERLARMLIFDLVLKMWMTRYDTEVVSGLKEGMKGIDGVGAEAAWTEENLGTPTIRGKDVRIRLISMRRITTE